MSREFSQLIDQMSDLSGYDKVLKSVLAEGGSLGNYYISKFHRQCMVLADNAGLVDKAKMEKWLSISFNFRFMRPMTGKSHGNNLVLPISELTPIDYWDLLEDEAFHFYWRVGSDVGQHPLLRAHTLMVLWESRSLLKGISNFHARPIEIAELLIENLCKATEFQSSRKGAPDSLGLSTGEYFEAAVHLSIKLRLQDSIFEWINRMSFFMEELITFSPHWALRFLKIERLYLVSIFQNAIDQKEIELRLQKLKKDLDNIDRALFFQDATHRKNLVLERIEIERFLGDEIDNKEANCRVGYLYEEIAEKAENYVIKLKFWMDAASSFEAGQNYKKRDFALKQSRESVDKAMVNGDMKHITVPMVITEQDFNKGLGVFFDNVSDNIDILLRLSSHLFAVKIFEETSGDTDTHIQDIIPVTPIIGNRPQKTITYVENIEASRQKEIIQDIGLSNIFITRSFDKLINENDLRDFEILCFLSSSEVIDVDDLKFIEAGVQHFFQKEWFACAHILIPRVENIVRNIVDRCGGSISAYQGESVKEVSFGKLLSEAKKHQILPPEIVLFFQATYSEDWGLNYRNNVAHGWLKAQECDNGMCSRVLHTILVLSRLKLQLS